MQTAVVNDYKAICPISTRMELSIVNTKKRKTESKLRTTTAATPTKTTPMCKKGQKKGNTIKIAALHWLSGKNNKTKEPGFQE